MTDPTNRLLIDGHLDLAFNAGLGRDLTGTVGQLRAADPVPDQLATVTFPELRQAGLRVCLGTLFAAPLTPTMPGGYTDAEGAHAQATAQLDQYHRWQDAGWIRLLTSGAEVTHHIAESEAPLGVVLLMEGADPVRSPDDLAWWVERGVKIVGLAWGATRYAGGTDAPGPLTPAGRDLVKAMQELGVTLDASHLDDASFWDAGDLGPRMIASHSNARALVPGNRHLTDDMARAIATTGGVIGLVYLSRFLRAGIPDHQRVPLEALAEHARHYAELIGWDHVALGTDMDGGFGADKTPLGIESYRDVPSVLDLLPALARAGVAGGNWARWLQENL
ncbi:peptidase M19 [Deinococcus sp. KSM4-11]|uniref:dipeptidase n=1 Tax=Deinococcus sp. KSM4-11 TaxID=2568654 RepID=UPI0010A47745|nr:membrane dipeptidase [Deinococcus sp. KSM4-11]THF88321.1 peptidase M19 [Deinococcus sp. KSM4-11]